jgi:hypothetical protein
MCASNLLALLSLIAVAFVVIRGHISAFTKQERQPYSVIEIPFRERLLHSLQSLCFCCSIIGLYVTGLWMVDYGFTIYTALSFAALGVLLICCVTIAPNRKQEMILRWLNENGYQVEQRLPYSMWDSPFEHTSDSQSVMRLEVVHSSHGRGVIHVRWGSYSGLPLLHSGIPVWVVWETETPTIEELREEAETRKKNRKGKDPNSELLWR